MPAPAIVFAVRLVGRGDVKLMMSHAEAERVAAGLHRDGIPTETYEVQISSWRRIPGHGDEAAAS
jgi:hypothetical protein